MGIRWATQIRILGDYNSFRNLNIINVLYNVSNFLISEKSCHILFQPNWAYWNFVSVKNIETSVSFIPIKIVGFSFGLLSKLSLAKGKKKSFKRTIRICETHNAKPTNPRGLHTKYNVHTFARLHFSALLLPFLHHCIRQINNCLDSLLCDWEIAMRDFSTQNRTNKTSIIVHKNN